LLRPALTAFAIVVVAAIVVMEAGAAGNPMTLVGALNPWKDGQFSNVAADASRHVGYLGAFDNHGVAVIKTTDTAHPVLTDVLSTHITSSTQTSDSADLDLVGRYLAVSHQPWTDGGTEAVFIVDIQTGTVVGTYQSPEPQGCYPSDADCQQFNWPHDA
jgi:hypothetical protein